MKIEGYKNISIMSQPQLKEYVAKVLKSYGYTVYNRDGYVLGIPSKNAISILLTAHMDIVKLNPLKELIIEKHDTKTILSAPKDQYVSGDDRCGCYIILSVLESGKRPYILFCEDEEQGSVGATKFIDDKAKIKPDTLLKNVSYILEIDRRNANDIIYYDCGNEEFQKYIETNLKSFGYKKNYGSCSDISTLSPYLDIASCNISCGYYNEHYYDHYIVWEEMVNCFKAVMYLLSLKCDKLFDYQEVKYDSYYGFDSYLNKKYTSKLSGYVTMEIGFIKNHELVTEYMEGDSEEEIIGQFLMEHPNLTYNNLFVEIY